MKSVVEHDSAWIGFNTNAAIEKKDGYCIMQWSADLRQYVWKWGLGLEIWERTNVSEF